MNMRPVRGMKDLLIDDYAIHNYIESKALEVGKLFAFSQISTPILEYSDVYFRTLGEYSDVVSKETYSFTDRGGDLITMRPEFTAGIMRSVLSNGLIHNLPLKFFSSGPIFRYDRPQAGRQRQFHQINFEYIGGESSPYIDAQIISLACSFLNSIELLHEVKLEINSLGCTQSRQNYLNFLVKYLENYKNDLSEDSKNRLEKNPLRILDSKSENDRKILENAPLIKNHFTKEASYFFEKLLTLLDSLKIKYHVNHKLVRGLDYYCHTAFEFTSENLGSQATVLGGGRYDGLSKIMSQKYDFPAIGFAAGIERLAILSKKTHSAQSYIAIITIGDDSYDFAFQLSDELRNEKIASLLYSPGKIGKKIEQATKDNCKYAIFVGQDDIKLQKFKLKNLENGEEKLLSTEEIINFMRQI